MNIVTFRESFYKVIPVLPDPLNEIRRDTDIQGAVWFARKYVNTGYFHEDSWIPAFAGMTDQDDHWRMRLILTGSELEPHAASAKKSRILCSERMYGSRFDATNRSRLSSGGPRHSVEKRRHFRESGNPGIFAIEVDFRYPFSRAQASRE